MYRHGLKSIGVNWLCITYLKLLLWFQEHLAACAIKADSGSLLHFGAGIKSTRAIWIHCPESIEGPLLAHCGQHCLIAHVECHCPYCAWSYFAYSDNCHVWHLESEIPCISSSPTPQIAQTFTMKCQNQSLQCWIKRASMTGWEIDFFKVSEVRKSAGFSDE